MQLPSFITTKVLGVALAASLLTNVGLFVAYNVNARLYHNCRESVVAARVISEEKKTAVETVGKVVVENAQDRTTRRIADVTRRVHESSSAQLPDTSGPAPSTGGDDSATVVLPRDQYLADQLICVTNTVLAEEWQTFYREVRKSYDTYSDTRSSDLPSKSRRTVSGSVQGQPWYMDMGFGGYELVRPRSLSEVQGRPTIAGRLSKGSYLAAPGEISTVDRQGIQSGTLSERVGSSTVLPLEYRSHREDAVAEASEERSRDLPTNTLLERWSAPIETRH